MVREGDASRRQRTGGREWVGGRLAAPMYVTEGEPYRPDMILWLELPERLIVGTRMVHPADPLDAVSDCLLAAMQRPMIGRPRRPDRIRVADAHLADTVRAVLGASVAVRVAPTPELDHVVSELGLAAAGDDAEPESYLEGGRVSPSAVADLFGAAEVLYTIAPWKHASDAHVLRVDIPELDVHGACLSIIGALGQSLGILLFPSLAGYERFADAAEGAAAGGPVDLGTTCLALDFERGADLPPAMRHEIAEQGWPVAGPRAYPRVHARERDGLPRPLAEKDVHIVTVCARSLSAFCARHGTAIFTREVIEPICESYAADDLTVRLTIPYEAAELFEVNDPQPGRFRSASRIGRNDPCPCGSGRKYKKCHLGAELPGRRDQREHEDVHARDRRVVGMLLEWAERRYGSEWIARLAVIADDQSEAQLVVPWCAYHMTVAGRRLPECFLEARAERLPPADRAWLTAQLAAWLSVWEVDDVDPGESVQLTDLLTGERRRVRERGASRTLVRRDAVLARVVDHDGASYLCGTSPRPLPPLAAAEVVRRTRAKLRLRRDVPPERLRDESLGVYMMARWWDALAQLERRAGVMPVLQNTDGDPLLLTTDHFDLAAGGRSEIETRLAALGAEAVSDEPGARSYHFYKDAAPERGAERTIIGRVRLKAAGLALETNSIARADRLRQQIEQACGDRLRHRLREHVDPRSERARADAMASGARAPSLRPAEAARIERELKQRHYERWIDEPVPALDGCTPRDAVRTRAGRARVEVLLKDIENRESRLAAEQRVDLAPVRRALGLAP